MKIRPRSCLLVWGSAFMRYSLGELVRLSHVIFHRRKYLFDLAFPHYFSRKPVSFSIYISRISEDVKATFSATWSLPVTKLDALTSRRGLRQLAVHSDWSLRQCFVALNMTFSFCSSEEKRKGTSRPISLMIPASVRTVPIPFGWTKRVRGSDNRAKMFHAWAYD